MFVGITFITRSLFEKCFERTHTIAIKTRNEELFHKVKRIESKQGFVFTRG